VGVPEDGVPGELRLVDRHVPPVDREEVHPVDGLAAAWGRGIGRNGGAKLVDKKKAPVVYK